MAFEFKKGCFYWEYVRKTKSNKLNRLLNKKCFMRSGDATAFARKKYKEGKWLQGNLVFVENMISHKDIADLDTTGRIKKYNPNTKKFEELG